MVTLAARAADAQTAPAPQPDPAASPPPVTPVAPTTTPAPPLEAPEYETVITNTTPQHGSRLPLDHVPANVRSVSSEDLAEHHSLDLTSYLGEAVGSVHINDVQSNPLQPDLQYRGFLASPLLGAPQGLSMYLDGVRLNEPFGDTINWDLLPTNAIRSVEIMPGSNPVFGLNTLGGALSLETKTGFSDPGADGTLLYGSWGRKVARANAGAHGDHFGIFAAADVFDEDGWRELSPSSAQHAFLSGSYQNGGSTADLSLMAASSNLTGNGVSPIELLNMDRRAVFTAPDATLNQMFMAVLRGERPLAPNVRLSGTAYARTNQTKTLNGDQHDWAQCNAMMGSLCTMNDDGSQTPIVDSAGKPVAFDDAYDAAFNRTYTRQTSYGVAGHVAVDAPIAKHENHLFAGADAGQSRIRFRSSTTVGTLDDTRTTIDAGFEDPTAPISVNSTVDDFGVYASDTFSIRKDLFFVASGRFNLTSLELVDQLGQDPTVNKNFDRINPAVGLSYQPRPWIGGYVSYSESNRAPTAIELTCASPDDPCRLPNAFVSDPPLAQVVAHTVEGGARGRWKHAGLSLAYDVTGFQTINSNDILFISSGMVANQGYFANVGETRRRGIEADLTGRGRIGVRSRLEWSLHYTLTDARFESAFQALSATHPDAVNGLIDVPAGAHIPSIPEHVAKAGLTFVSAYGFSVGANAIANSGQYYRGDEANLLGKIPGYIIVNARAAYQIIRQVSVFALVDNVFNTQFSTFGVLGDATDVFPNDMNPRFLGPGAPRAGWVGLDLHD